jgi:UDP-glucose 4-epimerase
VVKLVFASTRQVYGRPRYLPVDESHPLDPVDVNGINKLAGEWYHRLYSNVHGLRTCVLRLTNTVGPRMRVRDARQTFVGVWVRQLLEGKPIEVWGGSQRRDFNFVDDVVDALLQAGAAGQGAGEVFNLGGDEVVSVKALAELVIELNGAGTFAVREFPANRKAIDIGDYYSDFQRIQTTLGWQPRVPLREALSRTLAYYREHLHQYV